MKSFLDNLSLSDMTEEEASIIDKNIAKKVSKYVRPAERKISSRQLKVIVLFAKLSLLRNVNNYIVSCRK